MINILNRIVLFHTNVAVPGFGDQIAKILAPLTRAHLRSRRAWWVSGDLILAVLINFLTRHHGQATTKIRFFIARCTP
jgi:hypothetical protein